MKRVFVAFVLVAVSSGCRESHAPADGGSKPTSWGTCIEAWPPARTPALLPSLSSSTPTVLFAKSTGYSELGHFGGVVASAATVVVASGFQVLFMDRDGNQKARYRHPAWLRFSPATLSRSGFFVAATAGSIVAFKENGEVAWESPLPGRQNLNEFFQSAPWVVSNDDVLYGVGSDNTLLAVRASDGMKVWSSQLGADASQGLPAQVMGGAGNAIFVRTWRGAVVFDRNDGRQLGSLTSADGVTLNAYEPTFILGGGLDLATTTRFVLDRCGKQRWSSAVPGQTRVDGYSGIVDSLERIVEISSNPSDSGTSENNQVLSLWTFAGEKVASGRAQGQPIAAGADGTTYVKVCPETGGNAFVAAFDQEAKELWRLDIGLGCPVGKAALLDDGRLLMVREAPENNLATEIVAIQTASPGLARSSWPAHRRDNGGTSWLE